MDLRERHHDTARRHPWERARLSFVEQLVATHAGAGSGPVVDIGAGDGYVAAAFADTNRAVFAVDAHYTDADIARLRTPSLQPSREAPTDVAADVVLLLDVIEHVHDDVGLLRIARDLLTKDGIAVITVPAWPALFSSHDRALLHHRRYTPTMLRTAIAHAGLRVVVDGGVFHGLLLPRAFAVLAERLRPGRIDAVVGVDVGVGVGVGVGHFAAPAVVGDVITAALRAEQRLSDVAARRGLAVPGLSQFAVVRR